MEATFADRLEAGRALAEVLREYRDTDSIVLGMARGGVEVGYAVASSLNLPLKALVIRKLGAPNNPELAIGAVSETGERWLDAEIIRATRADDAYIEREIAEQVAEAKRRQREYAAGPGVDAVRGKTAIVVDDGIATGASALVAVRSARGLGASRVILAVPVASQHAVNSLRRHVDRMVVLAAPEHFRAVGLHYTCFDQVTDAEVIRYLQQANAGLEGPGGATPQTEERTVGISAGPFTLPGTLALPQPARGIVLFAHGSGSGRFSPRNIMVARQMQQAGLATLLIDLLTEPETQDRHLVFDIELLANRLLAASGWLHGTPDTRELPIGYFGASTGAGAALVAAARMGQAIRAVVSRGGRPDLAGDYLARVQAPTLLIVGGDDQPVIPLNQQALAQLQGVKELKIVPGATHLFEESGALEQVAQLARDWFLQHLPRPVEVRSSSR